MLAIRYPADLPITSRRDEILNAIRNHQVVVLAGETGSGKTTQLPKMCLEAMPPESRGKIGCTQPRRVAAMSVSRRVAEELGVQWGREVGCKMRFSDDTGRDTRIKFMTDGILLAEIQSDPLLRQYSMIILDEAHERSLNIDFLLGYLQTLLQRRPDLKLLVTSATIDTEAFSKAFGGAPIIEVSGRMYPVDVRYAPVEAGDDDISMLDATVNAVEDALIETDYGDVLVFMPTERDIRETRDLLDGRLGRGIEVLALFGRMPAGEQQRIFAPGQKRRVVIATNVAETSITIPRIRYVVDTGLARISRYNPRTRTKRLPVEEVSQSSANQRAGRAGRIQDGVCIRLYSQEDFEKRPRFTQPEIQRSNLAEVILRMKAFKLGEIETFPFINPPASASIRSGYELLHELGALDETHEMTGLGRELARLPLDPTLGRMLLQAQKEKALAEMLVIAAGLSVPDPRERPEEAKEQAAAAHKAFTCPDSDFLTLLRIWQAAPDVENRSNNALRRFCKSHFLSLTRMREWRDIWRQLRDTLDDEGEPLPSLEDRTAAHDDAVHRSILTAQLGHIAIREERNLYKGAGNRQLTVFPGSCIYERREKKPGKPGTEKTKQPLWIVAGEIVQTSQLFARTLAKIDPAWVAELGAHLCQYKYSEPHWHGKSGRVLVTERTLVHGLEVRKQPIDFGKIDPVAATQIFIRGALLKDEVLLPHRFFGHNRKLRDKIETTLTRVRSQRVYDIEEALFNYYEKRIQNVSSVHDLNRLVNERIKAEPNFLCATEEDLTGGDDLNCDLAMFPDRVDLGNSVLPVTYAYTPGQEQDGVTVQVPLPMAEHLTSGQLQWMVPGLREEQINVLLRALPKTVRRPLMPIDPKVREIAREFDPGRSDFLESLARFITIKYRVDVKASDWPPQSLPAHLQPRIEVVNQRKETIIAARDLQAIKATVRKQEVPSDAWDKAVRRLERYALTSWSFGDLPESVVIEEINGVPVLGYPGLALRDGEADLRLYRKPQEAARSSPPAVRKLAELALGRDLAWLWKELKSLGGAPVYKAPASFQAALSSINLSTTAKPVVQGSAEQLQQQAQEHILCHALRLQPLFPLTEKRFHALCDSARKELPLLVHRVRDLLKQTQDLKQKILNSPKRYPGLEKDIQRLLPQNLLVVTPHVQLQQLPRYLRAVEVRAERATINPAKDADKADLIADYDGWEKYVAEADHETFRWMLEDYRVSIFAQELGTFQPVSVKRLEAMMS
ncbi:MAG TPA: ATP-dependent RNA helicase HrpA [Verrucomicrobium sp.]|nr:ATP-dependent RNA helicase HrpA [Verrucomicrobium sp.]